MTRPATGTRAALTATALLFSLSGCFSYVPATLESTPAGEDVRVLVTRQGASELLEVTDIEGEVPALRGTLMGREANDVLLRVGVGQRREGFHTVSLDQTIRVPSGEILQVERRELDTGKTALLTGGAIAGSAFIIISIMDAFGGDAGRKPDQPQEIRIPTPFISIPVGR
ncbi:MAG: hypothetical protein U5R14_03120 [Gemmatimonadota bacterium]|nr:hypothetical protein [Gemmatimonadota bacterium]